MPIGYLSLWVQPRSLTSGDLSWPWNFSGTMSRVTSSHVFTSISSTIPITVNRTTPSCVYSRFRWNLVEGCSSYDVITSWPDLTRPNFFHQKLRKRCPISYGKFQRDSPNGVASSSEKLIGGGLHQPPPDRARVKVLSQPVTSEVRSNAEKWRKRVIADNFASDGARAKFQRPACSLQRVEHVTVIFECPWITCRGQKFEK